MRSAARILKLSSNYQFLIERVEVADHLVQAGGVEMGGLNAGMAQQLLQDTPPSRRLTGRRAASWSGAGSHSPCQLDQRQRTRIIFSRAGSSQKSIRSCGAQPPAMAQPFRDPAEVPTTMSGVKTGASAFQAPA